MNILLMILGVLGIFLQFFTRKQEEKDKSIMIVSIQYLAMLLIVLIGGYSQYHTSKKDKEYKQAVYKINVLSKVSESFIPALQYNAEIKNNMIVTKNYLSFEKAKSENPKIKNFINWYRLASQDQVAKLNKSKKALKKLKSIAANIVKLDIEYPNTIPTEILNWSDITLNINFNDIEKYFDPYASTGKQPKQTVMEYQKKLGKAFGSAMGTIRRFSTILITP